MTPEQKTVFVMAQIALLNADVAMMQAANEYRTRRGETIAYGEEEMYPIIQSYHKYLAPDNLISFFKQ